VSALPQAIEKECGANDSVDFSVTTCIMIDFSFQNCLPLPFIFSLPTTTVKGAPAERNAIFLESQGRHVFLFKCHSADFPKAQLMKVVCCK